MLPWEYENHCFAHRLLLRSVLDLVGSVTLKFPDADTDKDAGKLSPLFLFAWLWW